MLTGALLITLFALILHNQGSNWETALILSAEYVVIAEISSLAFIAGIAAVAKTIWWKR